MSETLQELLLRKQLAEYLISVLQTVSDEDERKPSALEHYRNQLTTIEQRIVEFHAQELSETDQSEGKPKDIVIGLKTAKLFAQPGKVGE